MARLNKARHIKKNIMKTDYQTAKSKLQAYSDWIKAFAGNDKPMIKQGINDHADMLCKDFQLTEHQRNLLANYACKLHPKEPKR